MADATMADAHVDALGSRSRALSTQALVPGVANSADALGLLLTLADAEAAHRRLRSGKIAPAEGSGWLA
jgi:hypothetical protein